MQGGSPRQRHSLFNATALTRPPKLLDRVLRIESIGTRIAAVVGPVPARPVGSSGRHHPAAGHFQMAVRVGVLDPFPRVAKPVVAFLFGQEREPGYFIPAPDERRLAWFAGIARAKVVELHHERQVLAGPAAGGDAALAPHED